MQDVHEITSAIASASTGAMAHVEAFGKLYDAKFDMLYRTVRHRTRVDESTALDIVQDAMMRIVKHMKVLRTERELDAWMNRVAMTTAYDSLRKDRRRRTRELRAVTASSSSEVRRVLELDDVVESLREELESLDSGAFDTLSMRFRTGMTLEAIGRRVGVGPGAADGRLRRTLSALRDRLKEAHDALE